MFKKWIVLLCFTSTLNSYSITDILNIGIYTNHTISSIIFSTATGEYELYENNTFLLNLDINESVVIYNSNGKIHFKKANGEQIICSNLKIKKKEWSSVFRIKPITPTLAERIYNDNLFITPIGNNLRLVNNVYIEHYIAGVIESEAGSKQIPEYYKVQAIICRTYALSNIRRHESENYNLCDKVHCQVYKSKNLTNSEILKATFSTKGLVLVDSDIKLINASFHSNCGGQTNNSEDVWTYPLPYLKSVCDTFCSAQPHANWEEKIPLEKWFKYMSNKHGYSMNDSTYFSQITNAVPEQRQRFLLEADSIAYLKDIRSDMKLKSTYFSIKLDNDSIVLNGNGFGHGVGLCQEGAMKMTKYGIPFNEVLHYYYTNVHLIDLSSLNFFRQD